MARDPSEVADRPTPESRRAVLSHTPLLDTSGDSPPATSIPVEQPASPRSTRGNCLRNFRLSSYLLKQADKTPPVIREHLAAVISGVARICHSRFCWLLGTFLIVIGIQELVLQYTAEREPIRLRPQKQRTADQLEIADDMDSAYRQWKMLQEANPKKFGNFSKFLVDTKYKESRLRKRLDELSKESLRLLNNIVVAPAGARPEYSMAEDEELTWNYLMLEKHWPYVGSERWLDKFNNGTRQYYNSLAVFPHNNRTRQHGLCGIWPNGTRAFIPGPMPPPINESPLGVDAELKDGGFYLKLSNALPLDRDVPDQRESYCLAPDQSHNSVKKRAGHEDLKPKSEEEAAKWAERIAFDYNVYIDDASVVIVYYNEHLSTLLRTVHSVLNQTPPPLLREIILVDDHSDRPEVSTGGFLDEYVKLLPKTKILRLPERRGIVQARTAGAKLAQAPIFVILDSHVEVAIGWLEPQIKRLMESPRSVVFPRILSLDSEDFRHRDDSGIGCFLSFKWMMQERPYFNRDLSPEPVDSPSMAGGLFAVRRDWFFELGGYDDEFKMWGAENVEMAFRYWQCGGRVECLPCSHTYHIFRRKGSGYKSPGQYIAKNRIRTAMLWTDNYYQVAREFLDSSEDFGDLDSKAKQKTSKEKIVDLGSFDKMKKLKRDYKCKSFDWFLRNIDKDRSAGAGWEDYGVLGDFPNIWSGGNKDHPRCIDTLSQKEGGKPFGLYSCHGSKGSQGFFEIKKSHQIRNMGHENMCLAKDLTLSHCDRPQQDSIWRFGDQWIMAAKSLDVVHSDNFEQDFLCLGLETNDKLKFYPCREDQGDRIRWRLNYFKWDPNYAGPEELQDLSDGAEFFDPHKYDDEPFDYHYRNFTSATTPPPKRAHKKFSDQDIESEKASESFTLKSELSERAAEEADDAEKPDEAEVETAELREGDNEESEEDELETPEKLEHKAAKSDADIEAPDNSFDENDEEDRVKGAIQNNEDVDRDEIGNLEIPEFVKDN